MCCFKSTLDGIGIAKIISRTRITRFSSRRKTARDYIAKAWCTDGIYIVPENRAGKRIVMQDDNSDVPGCVSFPVEAIIDFHTTDKKPYFTSKLAHMLVYAIFQYREAAIEMYGFEAESNTEYAVQRPCIEYWVGYGRGFGMSIEAPGSGLLKGKHYGYKDFDQGYRSRLELRKHALQDQLSAAEIEAVKSEAALQSITGLIDNHIPDQSKPYDYMEPVFAERNRLFDDHFRKKNFVSFLRGTLKELNHAIEILDAYRQDSEEATQADTRRLIEIPYSLG
jgi:hypothetical protein